MKNFLRFVKYNAGIIVTAVFMMCVAYREFQHPKYGRENVPKIYLSFAVILLLVLITVYYKYFHGKEAQGGKRNLKKRN